MMNNDDDDDGLLLGKINVRKQEWMRKNVWDW